MMKAEKNDIVRVNGKDYVIDRIMYVDCFEQEGWFIEFMDTEGDYHYWKQYIDGGEFIKGKKKYYDCYGIDVTDIFRKYGYC